MQYQALTGLKIEDYSYPGENDALNKLVRSFPVLADILGFMQDKAFQAQVFPQKHGDLYRVTEKTCPYLDGLFQTAKERLDIDMDIPLFVEPMYEYNAYTMGTTRPIVVIASSFVNNCSADTLLFVLGHELGHIKSQHLAYGMLASNLVSITNTIPKVGKLINMGLTVELYSWYRMNEFTSDRAGAIAAGGIEQAMLAIQTLLGMNEKIEGVSISVDDLLAQNTEFQMENKNIVSKTLMLYNIMYSRHPWSIDRICKLKEWGTSGEFEALVGKYISASEA